MIVKVQFTIKIKRWSIISKHRNLNYLNIRIETSDRKRSREGYVLFRKPECVVFSLK